MKKEFKENPVRKLAKSNRWQSLYARAKELSSIRLFDNETNLSYIQLVFLNWLETYNSLFMDLAIDKKGITEDVIKDEIRTDAYLLWRSKNKNSKKKRVIDKYSKIPSVIFSKRKK